MKKYLLLIDEEWFEATLSNEEVVQIKEDIEGMSTKECTVKLDNGDIIETGIIDEIKDV